MLQWSRRSGREISQARVTALIALTYAAQNRTEDAMRAVREMVQTGERLGLARCIFDLGEKMQLLLKQYCEVREARLRRDGEVEQSAACYARRLLDMADTHRAICGGSAAPAEAAAPGVHGIAEPLTRRELEILRLVNEGRSNQEIADELLIAATSVKWHMKNIFSKLYVSSRTQAIARAREAKIILMAAALGQSQSEKAWMMRNQRRTNRTSSRISIAATIARSWCASVSQPRSTLNTMGMVDRFSSV